MNTSVKENKIIYFYLHYILFAYVILIKMHLQQIKGVLSEDDLLLFLKNDLLELYNLNLNYKNLIDD